LTGAVGVVMRLVMGLIMLGMITGGAV